MESTQAQEKIQLVWGCVFLAVVAYLGLMGFVLAGGMGIQREEPILGAFLCSALLSVVTVPLLLTVPGGSPTLIAGGRILLWTQAAAVLTAVILIMVEVL